MDNISKLPFDMTLMEVIKDMVFMVSVKNNSIHQYEFFNQAVFKKTHLTKEDIGKTFQQTHNEKISGFLNKQYGKVLTTKKSLVYEDSYVAPSGEHYYSETTLTPLFNDEECTYIVGIVKDVTNEKKAEIESEEAWERLKESRSRYRSLYENNADAIFSLDLNGHIVRGNEAVEKMTAYPLPDLVGAEFRTKIIEKDRELLDDYFQLALEGTFENFRTKFIGKSGQFIGVSVQFTPVEVKHKVVGVYAIVKSMEELYKMYRQYAESENRFRIIAENAHDVIVLMDTDGETLYVSPSSKRVYGFEPEEHMGKSPFHNVHPEDIPSVMEAFSRAISEAKTYVIEVRLKHKTKGWIWAEAQGTPIFDEDNNLVHIMTITSDITLYKKYEAKLQFYAYHDSLTGLPNRRFFKERFLTTVNQSQEKDELLGVLLLDIDHFKTINDQLGHEVGDAVIEEFGNRLSQVIEEQDLVARLGGDEFVILLPNLEAEGQATNIAKKILLAMENSWPMVLSSNLKITTSIGITVTPSAQANLSAILKKADLAMYEAKDAGRNTYRIL